MINLFGPKIPNDIYVACSGGIDSMAALTFLANKPYRKVTAAFFNHGTADSANAQWFLEGYLPANYPNIKLVVGDVKDAVRAQRVSGESPEEFWRNKRYEFLHGLNGPVIMAHHLDDCIENWMFTAMHGNPHVIPYRNKNVVRPFLTTPKSELTGWCLRHKVFWAEDASNDNEHYPRNRIRKSILPEVRKINPGIAKVVARKVEEGLLSYPHIEPTNV